LRRWRRGWYVLERERRPEDAIGKVLTEGKAEILITLVSRAKWRFDVPSV